MPRPPTNPNGTPMTNDQRSFLVILSAHALGSIGFGLSLLAISLGWLIPVNLTRNPDIPKPIKSPVGKSRRHSSTSQTLRVVSAPVVLDPILSRRSREYFDKRVYFVDSQRPQRRQTLPSDHKHTEVTASRPDLFRYVSDPPLASISSSASPRSSTSTLATTPTSSPPNTEVALLSNSALGLIEDPDTIASLSRNSTRVPRIRNVFHRKQHPDVTTNVDQSVPSDISRSSSTRSRSSWSFGRPHTPDEKSPEGYSATSAPATRLSFARRISGSRGARGSRPSTPTNQPSPTGSDAQLPSDTPLPSTSAFFRKSERQPAPRRRTSPYEAPYFAEPPTIRSEIYPVYLRTLPQFGDGSASSSSGSLGADEFGRTRLQKHDHSQTSLNRVERPTHKSRSTSEGHLFL